MGRFGVELNENLELTLEQAVDSGRLPHAIILEGGSPRERMDLAYALAAAQVCTGAIKPCGSCPSCIKSKASSHPDVLLYSVEDKPLAFKIDIVREICNVSYILPNEADKKVFILENAHTMHIKSQNAFLKILEEPPKYVCFILLCRSKADFLPTVLSRATVYRLGEQKSGGDNSEISERALSAAKAVAKACMAQNELDIIIAAAVFEKDKELLRAALPVLEQIFAAAVREKHGAGEGFFDGLPYELSNAITGARLLNLTEQTRLLMKSLDAYSNHNLLITRMCTCLRRAAMY